ncbi:uncharacterized protein LOC144106239 [Amblyomma americanum]
MTNKSAGKMLRLGDGGVEGVAWRPIRFADDTVLQYACSLCEVIVSNTLRLPCKHVLCETCLSSLGKDGGGGGGNCPLDQKRFDGKECTKNLLPAWKVNNFKAYCWNQVEGCQFVGPLTGLLRHYEGECSFHRAQCPRCGARVLRTGLAAHYAADCRSSDPTAANGQGSPEAGGPSRPQAVNAGFEDNRTPQRKPHQENVPTLCNQVQELTVQETNCRDALLPKAAEASTGKQQVQNRGCAEAEGEPATTLDKLRLQIEALIRRLEQHYAEEGRRTRGPGSLEIRHAFKKLELAANESLALLEEMGSTTMPPKGWYWKTRGKGKSLGYFFDLKNADKFFNPSSDSCKVVFPQATRWHSRDAHFTIVVKANGPHRRLEVLLRFGSTLEAPCKDLDLFQVWLFDQATRNTWSTIDCANKAEVLAKGLKCAHIFFISQSQLQESGSFERGEATIYVQVSA